MEFHEALKKAMEHMGLQPKQTEAIQSFVSGRDSFVSLPSFFCLQCKRSKKKTWLPKFYLYWSQWFLDKESACCFSHSALQEIQVIRRLFDHVY